MEAIHPQVPRAVAAQATQVHRHFRVAAGYWRGLYERTDVVGVVFQDRQKAAMRMVAGLQLPPRSRVLEVGCGAGYLTRDLAGQGMRVTAADAVPEMLELTGALLHAGGLADSVELLQVDAHALQLASGSFDLVIALGVVPWLHSPPDALSELWRVLRPGGHLVVTSDNRARLNHLVDPRFWPLLGGSRWLRAMPGGRPAPTDAFHPHLIWPARFRKLVVDAGFQPVAERTVGFGPFSILGHPVLRGGTGVALHGRLQRLADDGLPVLRSLGAHQVILARRPGQG